MYYLMSLFSFFKHFKLDTLINFCQAAYILQMPFKEQI